MVTHKCLLCQSCTSVDYLSPETEAAALSALRILTHATWRRRAWILQEILLSRNYVVSWDDSGKSISLVEIGVIAALLFRRNTKELWLNTFASWCRRLWYLRQNYEESEGNELCHANVLQLTSGLEATVPSDKYYALCGILRLKYVKPNSNHCGNQALDVIIKALVQEGRMSWLYAVPPAVSNHDLTFHNGVMTPSIMTRLEARLGPSKNHKAVITSSALQLQAVLLGRITVVLPLSSVLDTAFSHLRATRDFEFPEPISHCIRVPDIIQRLSLEIVDPLLSEPTFSYICKALKLDTAVKSEGRKAWLCLILLAFVDKPLIQEMCEDAGTDAIQMVEAAAISLQQHLNRLRELVFVVFWKNEGQDNGVANTALTFSGSLLDASIFFLEGEPESLFAVRSLEASGHTIEFCGSVFLLNVRHTYNRSTSFKAFQYHVLEEEENISQSSST